MRKMRQDEIELLEDQIRRMIDHLPENHFCEQIEGECQILMDLLISDWAKKFLIQMIGEKEEE